MLSPLQQRVARRLAALPGAENFALAGGAALVTAQVVDRQTRDLDFFGPNADEVGHLAEQLQSALLADGMAVTLVRSHRGFVRLEVADGEDVTEVDLGVDARIRPAEQGPLGPMLSLEELAADKLLALFGRAQARDFVDVEALVARFGLERLCVLASEKDPGFSTAVLRQMLGTLGRYTAADLDLDENGRERLVRTVDGWRAALPAGQ